jgi:hypothetical protein
MNPVVKILSVCYGKNSTTDCLRETYAYELTLTDIFHCFVLVSGLCTDRS